MQSSFAEPLQFTGRFLKFVGKPEKNFYMIISAAPGHGKTTLALNFANYLTNFGKVGYVVNEENEARIKRKLEQVKNIVSPELLFSFENLNVEQIKDFVNRNGVEYLFIDSLQQANMDAVEMNHLKAEFPDIALIVISRSTKVGVIRGSQNKEYDSDINVVFTKQGIAQTIKNRFAEVGLEYALF